MTARPAAALLAATLAALPATGCESAVRHPAVTAGIVGGTLGFATCKLASDSYPACLGVGAGAGAFLAVVAAAALWLGGDGNTVMVEEQAKPLPDARPRHRRPAAAPDDGTAPAPMVPPPAAAPATPSPPADPASAPTTNPPPPAPAPSSPPKL
jgi:hypothetical protein